MKHPHIICALVAAILSGAAPASAADEDLQKLTDALLQTGSTGTLVATAAGRFGLPYRDYPERYVEVSTPDGIDRSIEVAGDDPDAHIFFSYKTRAELTTIRLTPDGEFIMGLQRPSDTGDVRELSGNQGRAFLENQKAYWLHRLLNKAE